MIKKFLLTSFVIICTLRIVNAQVQPLLIENFTPYSTGANLVTASSWTMCATGLDTLKVNFNNYEYPFGQGFGNPTYDPDPASGSQNVFNSIYFDSSSNNLGGYCNTFQPVNHGKVYLAFVWQDSTIHRANNNGDYFITLGSSYTSNAARILVKYSNGNTMFGVRKATGTDVWGTGAYTKGKDHLLVLVYEYNPATLNDDRVMLYVDPTLPGAEPTTPTVTAMTSDPDFTGSISNLFLRLNMNTANVPSAFIDNILVDTTWENISFAPCHSSFTVAKTNLAVTLTNTSNGDYHGYLYDYGDGSNPTSVNTHTYAAAGTYSISLTLFRDATSSINPCDTSKQSVTVTSVGINEYMNSFDAAVVYTNGVPTLKIISPNGSNVTVNLVNTLGQVVETVYSGNISAGEKRLTATTNVAGLYFYQITSDKGSKTFKAIFK